jgi:plasmid stabilization system protein ParE
MKVSVAALALEELQLAAEFYAERGGNELGLAFVAEFERVANLIALNPLMGSQFRKNRRFYPFRRFPYSVFYYISENDELRILAVAHQSRRPNYWLQRS